MKPLSHFPKDVARGLVGLIFDLDDTVLTGGALGADTYLVLHSLHAAGLRLVACTGRPASWGDVLIRQWPVELVVTENGALAFAREAGRIDRLAADERLAQRAALSVVVDALRAKFADVSPSDDSDFRVSDFAFDIGERHRVAPERVGELRRAAAELGARTFVSSIHLHVTLDTDDKASGTLFALWKVFGDDASSALARYAFVGDSANDEPCFGAFRTTLGVGNVRRELARLTVVPGYVSQHERGAGFVEIARQLLRLREAA